jgi:hypothetical protein
VKSEKNNKSWFSLLTSNVSLFSVLGTQSSVLFFDRTKTMKEPFYITTPIYYVNDVPHIGHAYEAIATDAIARFQRLMGRDVRLITGTDEHGLKMVQTARALGRNTLEFADEMSSYFNSAIAYIFMIIFTLLNGGLFMTQFFLIGRVDMRALFYTLPFFLALQPIMQQARPAPVITGQAGILLMLGDDEDAAVAVFLDRRAQKGRDRDTAFAVNRVQRMPPEKLPLAHNTPLVTGASKGLLRAAAPRHVRPIQ